MNIDFKSFKYSSFFLTAGIFAASGSTFLQNVILGRMLSKTDYASLMTLLSIIGFFTVISEFGLTQLCTLKFSRIKENNNENLNVFLKKSLLTSFLASFFSGFILIILVNKFYSYYSLEIFKPFFLFGVSWIPVLGFSKIVMSFFIGQKYYFQSFIVYSTIEPFKLTFLIVTIFFYKIIDVKQIFLSLNLAVWSGAVFIILTFILSWKKVKNNIPSNSLLKEKTILKDQTTIFPENFKYHIPFLTKFAIPYILVIIPGLYINSDDLSLILVCIPLLNIFDLLFQGINLTLLAHLPEKLNSDFKKNNLKKIINILLLTAACVFILLQLIKKNIIILLYGIKYIESVPYLGLLLIASLIDSIRNITDPILNSQGHSGWVMWADLLKLSLLFSGFLILVPGYKINGLIISYIITFSVSSVFKIIVLACKVKIYLYKFLLIFILISLSFLFIIN